MIMYKTFCGTSIGKTFENKLNAIHLHCIKLVVRNKLPFFVGINFYKRTK